MKRTLIGSGGVLVLLGVLADGIQRLATLFVWNSGYVVGYNVTTIVFVVGGIYMVRYYFKHKPPVNQQAE